MRRIALVALSAAALVLSGCGSSDDGLDAFTVGGSAKSPTVKADGDFTADKTSTKVVKEGDGDEVKEGDSVTLNYVAVNGRTGKTFDSSFKAGTPLTTTLSETGALKGWVSGLVGQKIGSRVLVAVPPKDGFNQANEQLGLKKSDTMVFLFDLVRKVPDTATGKAQKLSSESPSIVLNDDKEPSGFKPTSKTPDKVSKAEAYVAIKGEGAKVESGQALSVQYVGQVYPDGDVFDSSWKRGTPAQFQIGTGNLIKCWDQLLPGQTVGSRVVLVCPSDVAYGDTPPEGGTIKKGDDLVFAIDILSAS